MKIRIITSCTNQKYYMPDNALRQEEFGQAQDIDRFQARTAELKEYCLSAEKMYVGQQHIPLMAGINQLRRVLGEDVIDLWIVSAGYGLIGGNCDIVPYEATFEGMKGRLIDEWSQYLGIPETARELLARPADLTVVLVGEAYLRALSLDEQVVYGAPTLVFTSFASQKLVRGSGNIRIVPLASEHARRFSSALVGLKGQLVNRLLCQLTFESANLIEQLFDQTLDPLDLLAHTCADPEIDFEITIKDAWKSKRHREQLSYFIPEWDDRVDPNYDFENDSHSSGVADWTNEVYAHQIYEYPNYDGILVSRAVVEKPRKKWYRIEEMGIHRYLRVPKEFPVMGDCGAFSYLHENEPPYTTSEIIQYYTNFDFDYGVSIDHLIFGAENEQQRQLRYELTIHNAEQFFLEHRQLGLEWTPVGAIQGTDATTYAAAAARYVKMGYEYIALGGLVRSKTQDILRIASAVRDVIPNHVHIHLFGVARLEGLREFAKFGIRSVDSASYLRQAWMRLKNGYFSEQGSFTAIRIPYSKAIIRKFERVGEPLPAPKERIAALESNALRAIRDFAKNLCTIDIALDAVLSYETLFNSQSKMADPYRQTLSARPWEQCDCDICQKYGVEVVIFRGNNRNRRRGFHNTHVFYNIMQNTLLNPSLVPEHIKPLIYQPSMF